MRIRRLTQNQLLHLARQRRLDAEVLFDNKRYNGSAYMAGYAVECALKATVCRQLDEPRMPPMMATHDLSVLTGRAPRPDDPAIAIWPRMRGDVSAVRDLDLITEHWSSELRYETKNLDHATADNVLGAATRLTDWLYREFPGL